LGFTVIIDTRGSSYNAIKPILKTLEEGKIPTLKIHHVYLTKPDTFWQKQRTLLAKGKYRFEVCIMFMMTHEFLQSKKFEVMTRGFLQPLCWVDHKIAAFSY
jgi:hypothetical protein